MSAMASQITSLTIVYSTVYSDPDQRKHQSSASLAFVWGIHRGPVNFPHKWPVTRKMFPFDDVIVLIQESLSSRSLTLIAIFILILSMNILHSPLVTDTLFQLKGCNSLRSSTALVHWGQVMYICVSKPTIIGQDNGLSLGQREAII